MKVAVVNSAAAVGGAELSLLPVVRRLAADGARIAAFLPGRGPFEEALATIGVESTTFPLGDALRGASRQYGAASLVRLAPATAAQQLSLLRLLRRFRPDVVYCNGFRAQLGATAPARVLRVPAVWHVRDFVPETRIGRVWGVLGRRASLVIANSAATAQQDLLTGAKVVEVPNGIDLAAFSRRAQEPAGVSLLGMVGHLTEWKGHLRFVRVLSSLRGRGIDVRGAIAGGDLYDTATHDAYPARLKAEIARLGLAAHVDVREVAPEEMADWLSRLTVLVHCPDRPEPFGRALAEAMAVGVPVVAAAGPGAEEVVGDAGITMPLGDDGAVADAVARLLDDRALRADLAERGRERVVARFDEERYASAVAGLILETAR